MPANKLITDKRRANQKALAVLIDPDIDKNRNLPLITELANLYRVDYFFVGGSLLMEEDLDATMKFLKKETNIPILLFPGNEMQLHADADALLFISLISGRNPEYLIAKHVAVASKVKKMGIPVIPTGYILMHGKDVSTTSYITNTQPIPNGKTDLAVATAIAGELLGMQSIYLEGGSGTKEAITINTIHQVRSHIDVPLIVGGGIRSARKLTENFKAGADVQVIGTAIEQDPELIESFCKVRDTVNMQVSQI